MPLIRHTATKIETVSTPEAKAVLDAIRAEDPKPETAKAPAYTGRKASSDTMSKEDWAQKDKRISLQGVLQALLGSVNFGQYCQGTTAEEYLAKVEESSLRLAKFVAENGK